jgi:hypothetical protein
MSWTTPPTFSYGFPASVDDMNVIRNDLLYLYGEIFTTPTATIETQVYCADPSASEKTAAIFYIEHKSDNLYYRINVRCDDNGQIATLHITYRESPFADL